MPDDKFPIDAGLVSRLVREQFPVWAELPINPVEPGGWDNKTFHLGETMSVRLPSAAWYSEQVKKEQTWLPRLAPQLPLSIPSPIAMGNPTDEYPWHWSVYHWIEGETADLGNVEDERELAGDLARFLVALQSADATGGPPAGKHNFYRGGPLSTYDGETRDALVALKGRVDTEAVAAAWDTALESTWRHPPVWVHGDVAATNLLVRDGRLSAVIDFGCAAVGDPACDLTIAWTFFSAEAREAFHESLPLDMYTWRRARGWALWKAMITLARRIDKDPDAADTARNTIEAVLSELP